MNLKIISSLILPFILLLGLLSSCHSTKKVSQKIIDQTKDIPSTVHLMEVDNFGNIYIVDINNKLSLYDHMGQFKYDNYNKTLGQIEAIDVSNPLQILVFYKDYGLIKILDNTLAEIKSINLNNDKYFGLETVCKANDDYVWLVDPTTRRIHKIDEAFNSLQETNTFEDLGITDDSFLKIRENGNYLVALHKREGFLIFDNFGQFIKKMPANNAYDFQFDGSALIFETKTSYRYQKIKFPDFAFISLPLGVNKTKIKKARRINKTWVIAYIGGVNIIKE
jgi:hypothetical protein